MPKIRSIVSISTFISIILYYFTLPCFVWHIPLKNIFDIVLLLVVLVVFYRNRKTITSYDQMLIFLFIFIWCLYIVRLFTIGSSIYGIIPNLPVCFMFTVFILKKDFIEEIINKYITIYSIFISLSLLAWFLLPMMPSLGVIDHYSPGVLRQYDHYPFLVNEKLGFPSIRFYGLFDEPGVVGTIGAILLCVLKFNFKDIRTWVILVSGICSMSFFFYASVAIYSTLYLLLVKKALPQTIILCLTFVVFYQTTNDHPIMSEVLWERFEWNSDSGSFEGDNRVNESADKYFDTIRGTDEYFWGVNDVNKYWHHAEGTSSYKNVIAIYGFVFLFLYCLFYILFGFRYRDNLFAFCLFVFLFLLNIYQRSNIYSLLYGFLFMSLAMGVDLSSKMTHLRKG